MAVITNLTEIRIFPSDVYGYEANTDLGYARESFEITIPADAVVRVGTILELNYADMTATMVAAPADVAAVDALGDIGFFVGRDLPTNPSVSQDYENLTMTETGVGVAIVKGDGRSILKKGYLDLAGTQFYALPADVQMALKAKFTTENRFKVIDQQYTPA
jgi:hypothetical protein